MQRYPVEDMLQAGRELLGSGNLDVAFGTTIPSGASTCHFDVTPRPASADVAWIDYSNRLRERALRRIELRDPSS